MSLIEYSKLTAPLELVAYGIGFTISVAIAVVLTVDWHTRQQGASRYEARQTKRQAIKAVGILGCLGTGLLLMLVYWTSN